MAPLIPIPRAAVDTPEVRDLCEALVPGEIPVILSPDPPPWADPNQCTENVESLIERYGGTVEYGWQLWETLPGALLEAEFHAVWVDKEGRRHDVTPKAIPGITQIVFLPDPNLVYEGRQIDNLRRPLNDDPLIKAFIEAAEEFYEVTNRGELADYHGALTLTPEMQAIRQRQQRLQLLILRKYYS